MINEREGLEYFFDFLVMAVKFVAFIRSKKEASLLGKSIYYSLIHTFSKKSRTVKCKSGSLYE